MASGDIPSGYWHGPRIDRHSAPVRAEKISKTAWMDLYYDLYQQTHGEEFTSPDVVIEYAENQLTVLKLNGVRR